MGSKIDQQLPQIDQQVQQVKGVPDVSGAIPQRLDIDQQRQQVKIVSGILETIPVKDIKLDAIASTTSLVITFGHYLMSLAQSLPLSEYKGIQAQVEKIITDLERGVAKTLQEQETQETNKKTASLKLLSEGEPPLFVMLEQLNIQMKSNMLEQLNIQMKSKMTIEEAKQFTVLQQVLQIPGIQQQFMPFHQKAQLVMNNKAFTPVEAAQFLVQDTIINGTHAMLTNPQHLSQMPPLTIPMLNNFRNVSQNQQYIQQAAMLQQSLQQQQEQLQEQQRQLQQQHQEAVNKGEDVSGINQALKEIEKVSNDNNVLKIEVKNAAVVAKTAISKEGVIEKLKQLVRDIREPKTEFEKSIPSGIREDVARLGEKMIEKAETMVETDDIGREILKILKQDRQINIKSGTPVTIALDSNQAKDLINEAKHVVKDTDISVSPSYVKLEVDRQRNKPEGRVI